MGLQGNCQSSSTNTRVWTYVDDKGDTIVSMHYEDARILLKEVLESDYTDSILVEYEVRDSLNQKTIQLQKEVLMKMGQEKMNLEQMITNLEEIIKNKDAEIIYKDDIIKQQKKEIRKQKALKLVGYAGSIILPIITVLLIL